ncbi:MAG TPA: DUF6164 family protein [Mariprofundaceae bacterium]|nr:DUF6164 family protein [Mariprofundaceae bacterium]
MAELLFKLRNVPDDEAADIRQLLNDHEIDFYETHAGGWAVSMPAIWLHDDTHLERAKALIDLYQQQRAADSRAAYEQLRAEGQHKTVADKIIERPFQFLMLSLAVLFILYISLSPFLGFGS